MSDLKLFTSCFVNGYYIDQFYNTLKSYKYYGHTYPMRVYDWDNLPKQHIDKLTDLGVDVRKVERGDWDERIYRLHYGFKWKGLIESDSDGELFIDADTLFLDNLDDIIEDIPNHKLIVVPEYVNEEHRAGNLFNIGFMGVNMKHKEIFHDCIKEMNEIPLLSSEVPNTEMFSLCNYVERNNIEVKELDYTEYMHLWHNHKIKKTIHIQDGKFIVTMEDGRRVRFYHFTTHIDPIKGETQINRLNLQEKSSIRMWVKRHNNPVSLLYGYFSNNEDFNTIKETIEEWKIK